MAGIESRDVSIPVRGARWFARRVVERPLQLRIEQDHNNQERNGLPKAEGLSKDGHGIVVVFNHFSARDPVEILDFIFGNPVMRHKPVLSPVAYHMYTDREGFWETPGEFLDISFCPIVTEETMKLGRNKGYPLGYGMKEYFEGAVTTLQKGGIVMAAPQGTRREFLGDSTKPIIGTLIAQTDHKKKKFIETDHEYKKLDSYGLLFVGLGIKDANDYQKQNVGGLNPFKEYQLTIGPTFTKKEVMDAVGGEYREVDPWVFEQLNKIVPTVYRNPINRITD